MINTKIYKQKVDFKDINSIYEPFKKSCLKILRNQYKGRCLQGAYIVDIDTILKYSNLEISPDHLDGRGSASVIFKAHVIQKEEGDLIANCEIGGKQEGRLFGKTEYGKIMLLNHHLIKIIKKGDTIPIIVKKSKYSVLREKTSIFAVPYVPHITEKNNIYVCEGTLTDENVKKLRTYIVQINEINEWIKKLNSSDNKKFLAFDEIFYPFKNQKKPKLLENKNVNLLDISIIKFNSENMDNIIIPCDEIIKSKSFVLNASISALDSIKKTLAENKSGNWTIIFDNPYVIFESLYIHHIKHLLFLKDMVSTIEIPKEKNIYWSSLKEYKQ